VLSQESHGFGETFIGDALVGVHPAVDEQPGTIMSVSGT
jgi:hypothetical protein